MKFLKLATVMSLTGLSRSSVYLAISRGAFPKQISLGARSVVWLDSEIQNWMESRLGMRGE
ncbi:MAG: AlpA family transcriptional regulator [Methylobacter sp.]|nr:AlpA family transcriptional regulator [Methylobacter sp.]